MTAPADDIAAAAQRFATAAHDGQVDKAGAPYIGHPQRVAERVKGDPDAEAVAWLHDVVEDTPLGLKELRMLGFPEHVLAAVDALTRRDGEMPADYYARVRVVPLALRVKLADIADNSDETRLAALPTATAERLRKKYRRALALLGQGSQ